MIPWRHWGKAVIWFLISYFWFLIPDSSFAIISSNLCKDIHNWPQDGAYFALLKLFILFSSKTNSDSFHFLLILVWTISNHFDIKHVLMHAYFLLVYPPECCLIESMALLRLKLHICEVGFWSCALWRLKGCCTNSKTFLDSMLIFGLRTNVPGEPGLDYPIHNIVQVSFNLMTKRWKL